MGRGLWPSKCVFHMPSRLLSVTSSSSTWRRRPRGGAAAAASAGVSISPHPDFLAPPTGTLCHHAASACQRAAPGMVAAGTCDAPIPRPRSPAPAGAEGHELFPFAASRHRSRSTPSNLATPPLVGTSGLCSKGAFCGRTPAKLPMQQQRQWDPIYPSIYRRLLVQPPRLRPHAHRRDQPAECGERREWRELPRRGVLLGGHAAHR